MKGAHRPNVCDLGMYGIWNAGTPTFYLFLSGLIAHAQLILYKVDTANAGTQEEKTEGNIDNMQGGGALIFSMSCSKPFLGIKPTRSFWLDPLQVLIT
jgi:hypothetical protein